jgi:hypothetical protein
VLSPQPELVWQGRIHLGDEPGVYSDAAYSGLNTELPLTLQRTDPAGPDTTTLVVETQDVQTFSSYPGHLVTATLYAPAPADPLHYQGTVLASARLTAADNNSKAISINVAGHTGPIFVSVHIRIDTEVPPGLYDDFVVTRLLNRSPNFTFVASLGFSA